MREYYPLLIIGGVIGGFALVFIIAYLSIRSQKEAPANLSAKRKGISFRKGLDNSVYMM